MNDVFESLAKALRLRARGDWKSLYSLLKELSPEELEELESLVETVSTAMKYHQFLSERDDWISDRLPKVGEYLTEVPCEDYQV